MVRVVADANERAAVASRLDLQEAASIEADCLLDRPVDGKDIRLQGRLKAHVTQTCVVTLEPLAADIDVEFERLYVSGWQPETDGGEETIDPHAPDIEPLEGDSIDLGEAVVEELSLALDPYPRKPGVEVDLDEDERPPGPFDGLKALKRP